MATNIVTFRRLQREDLPLLERWLEEPHVKAWYANDEDYEAILNSSDPTRAFIILLDQQPIGYIQTYLIKDNPRYAQALDLGNEEERSAAMDLFIGDPEYVHRGLGAEIIKKFLTEVVFAQPEVMYCLIGPEPKNTSAIRAYEKAGFEFLKTIQVPGEPEPEYIMKLAKE